MRSCTSNYSVANHNHVEAAFSTPHEVSFITPVYSTLPASTFGECIRKARSEKGLTQKEVAEAIGVNEMTIVSWERRVTPATRLHDRVERLFEMLETQWVARPAHQDLNPQSLNT